MSDIILHHYDASPFSEKVRTVLGIKGLQWHSVEIPNIMPKPDLVPLTGGYRKTPVMQIGADIYCDSQCIIRELENRFPTPSLLPSHNQGLAWALGLWSDRHIFHSDVAVIFAALKDFVPAEFIEDRKKLTNGSFDPSSFTKLAPHAREQIRAHFSLIELQLKNSKKPFLDGDDAGLSDVHAYYTVWFLRNLTPQVLDEATDWSLLKEWEQRIKAIGHGDIVKMDSKKALAIAKESSSIAQEQEDPNEPNKLKIGSLVEVAADDYGCDAVQGTLVRSSALDIAIKRYDDVVGEVVVHFPRIGFLVKQL